jgi:hypothetical protein
MRAIFSKGTGHLDADCPCAYQREGQLPPNFLATGVFNRGHFFRSLERKQDLAANRIRVIQRFEARCELPPFVVPKIVVLNPRGKDEKVVRQLSSVKLNDAIDRVDACDLLQQHFNIFLTAEDRAQRPGNFIGRQQSCRDLV